MAAIKKVTTKVEGNLLNLSFAHGEELSLSANDLPNEMKSACLMHGLKQKVCDSFSGVTDPAECLAKAKGVFEALSAGNWTGRVAGEGGARVTQLARALSQVAKMELQEAVDMVAEMDDDTKKSLNANAEIKVAIAQIKAEEAAKAAEEASKQTDGPSISDILAGGGSAEPEATGTEG